jgi:hypothetical protein
VVTLYNCHADVDVLYKVISFERYGTKYNVVVVEAVL